MLEFIIFFIVLSILVLVHEFGHFVVAKKSGILVEEFGFGLPPRIWGKKIGETIYSLNWLPFGGFVKVFGEENHELNKSKIPADKLARAFSNKKPTTKLAVLTAGVIMNFILAIFIFYYLLLNANFVSDPLLLLTKTNFPFGNVKELVLVGSVLKDSPANKVKLENGDEIVQIKPFGKDWQILNSASQLITETNANQSRPMNLTTENIYTGFKKNLTVTPIFDQKTKRFIIGVGLADAVKLNYSESKLMAGIYHSINLIIYNTVTLKYIVASSIQTRQVADVAQVVSGPLGILSIIGILVKNSGPKLITNLLNLLALLSLSLGVINILPFPALDGGRVFIVLYETIRRKSINPKFEQRLNLLGFAFLLGLLFLVTINDIIKILLRI